MFSLATERGFVLGKCFEKNVSYNHVTGEMTVWIAVCISLDESADDDGLVLEPNKWWRLFLPFPTSLTEGSTVHSPPVHFFNFFYIFYLLLFFFFFAVEISPRTLIPLLRPGSVHSGSAS